MKADDEDTRLFESISDLCESHHVPVPPETAAGVAVGAVELSRCGPKHTVEHRGWEGREVLGGRLPP